jgi:hypothetical protein
VTHPTDARADASSEATDADAVLARIADALDRTGGSGEAWPDGSDEPTQAQDITRFEELHSRLSDALAELDSI